jgi:hypothetical protein
VENFIALKEIRTDLDLYEEEEDVAAQIDTANFIKLVKDGMSPDLVAQMVIYAIENDIFYILTHHQWHKIFENRLERIKADTLKIKEKFFTSKEVNEIVYEYRIDSLAFSLSYPDYLVKMFTKTHESQVFHATEELRRGVEVYVIDIEPEFRLENATTSIMDLFRYSGNNIQIISEEAITLEGGVIGNEIEFTYNRLGAIKVRARIVLVIKDDKFIWVNTYAIDGYFDDQLKKIGRSLNFSASVAGIIH